MTGQLSNLQTRVVSAVVLGIAALALTWLGGLPFRLLAALIAGAIFYEWTHMTRAKAGPGLGFVPEASMLVFLGVLVAGLPAMPTLVVLVAAVAIAAIVGAMRGAGQWDAVGVAYACLLYTSPSPRDAHESRMPSSA